MVSVTHTALWTANTPNIATTLSFFDANTSVSGLASDLIYIANNYGVVCSVSNTAINMVTLTGDAGKVAAAILHMDMDPKGPKLCGRHRVVSTLAAA